MGLGWVGRKGNNVIYIFLTVLMAYFQISVMIPGLHVYY